MFGTIQFKIIAAVVTALSLFFAGWTVNGWRYEKKEAAQTIAMQKALEEKEQANQLAVDQITKDKNDQIDTINTQLFSALSQLRNRTSRNNPSASNTKNGTGSTLFAEDAEFLIGEAARADKLRTALDACYKQYDQVAK